MVSFFRSFFWTTPGFPHFVSLCELRVVHKVPLFFRIPTNLFFFYLRYFFPNTNFQWFPTSFFFELPPWIQGYPPFFFRDSLFNSFFPPHLDAGHVFFGSPLVIFPVWLLFLSFRGWPFAFRLLFLMVPSSPFKVIGPNRRPPISRASLFSVIVPFKIPQFVSCSPPPPPYLSVLKDLLPFSRHCF